MIRRIALLGLLATLLGPGPAWADPALFVARAPGITAYLFGSIHVLKPGVPWRTPAIGRAFDDSSECWFELVLPSKGGATSTLPFLRGIDLKRRLPTLLSPRDNARLAARATALHVPGGVDTLDTMQPWLAWMMLDALGMVAAGMDPEYGVERVLQTEAEADGKAVLGLETLDDQVAILAAQPEPVALRALHALLADPAANDRQTGALVRAWLAGDTGAVGRAMSAATHAEPTLFRALLSNRNKAWAERLATLRGTGKTILVTVGAGHLAGPGNLRDLLRARGFTVERMQP